MKKRQTIIVGLEKDKKTGLDSNREFVKNFQRAILLSLLERGQLNQHQFELCVKELEQKKSV